jgi:hypothetical protein
MLHECGWRESLLDLLDEVAQIPHPMAEDLLKEYAEIVEDLEKTE